MGSFEYSMNYILLHFDGENFKFVSTVQKVEVLENKDVPPYVPPAPVPWKPPMVQDAFGCVIAAMSRPISDCFHPIKMDLKEKRSTLFQEPILIKKWLNPPSGRLKCRMDEAIVLSI
ncbi:hypothetical protein CsatB_010578 [Cannabis sativa]